MTRDGATRVALCIVVVFAALAAACGGSVQGSPAVPPTSESDYPAVVATPPDARPQSTATPEATAFTLVAVGDVMLGRSIGSAIANGGDPVFDDAVTGLISGADIAVANLESPISERGRPAGKSYTFRAPPAAAEVLGAAGFDVVALANNHALDYGRDALEDTEALLRAAGVDPVGAGADIDAALAPVVVERNGVRIAFVSLVDAPAEGDFSRAGWEARDDRAGLAWADEESVDAAVTRARGSADIVVVLLHAGIEFNATPTEWQRALARTAIDAGAALVLGTHPHVLQPVEEYAGGLIAYSLGNFVFDGFEELVEDSAVLRVTFEGTHVASWEMVPVVVEWSGRPRLAEE